MIERSELYAKTTEEFDSITREAAETNPFLEIEAGIGDGLGREWLAESAAARWPEARRPRGPWSEATGNYQESIPAAGPGIFEVVEPQIERAFREGGDRKVARAILDEMEEGFVPADICQLVARETGISQPEVEKILRRMQLFEPAGVFARSTFEALELQLRALDEWTPNHQAVLARLRQLRSRPDMTKLARACGLQQSELDGVLASLKRLNPRAVSGLDGSVAPMRVPDLQVVRDGSGGLRAIVHPCAAGNVEFAPWRFDGDSPNKLPGPLADARNAVARDRLYRTRLELVGTELVRKQAMYLLGERSGPVTLSQKDLAKATGLTEPDISRAVKGRTIDTPLRGTIEMQSLFAHRADLNDAIRALFQSLDEPSDRRILEELIDAGFSVTRRTVAYRRNALGIRSERGKDKR